MPRASRVCVEAGCPDPVYQRGRCKAHYLGRERRLGRQKRIRLNEAKRYDAEFKRARELVRVRDGGKCRRCDAPEPNTGKRFQVHHKDGADRGHRLDRLELLCPSCHGLADAERRRRERNR